MLPTVTTADPTLDSITAAILTRVQPRRIVLIGSRARGDAEPTSDYDIVIEVATGTDERATHSAALEALRGIDLWIDLIVCDSASIERWQDDPGMLHWDISREGVLLYPRHGADYERLEPRPAVVREREPDSVAAWLERADVDLRVIELLDRPDADPDRLPWAAVAFHAQQAAEKYLKAVLVKGWIKPPHGHKLHQLAAACRNAGFQLPEIGAECELLNQDAVDVRYPFKTPMPDAVEGRRVAEAGLRLVSLARTHLGR